MPIYVVRMERSDTVFMTVEAPNRKAAHGLAFEFVETAKATCDEWTASIKEIEGSVAERTKAMAMDDGSYYFVGFDGSYGGSYAVQPNADNEALPF